ncbi:MAG: hypothetical protein ABIE74_04540, partial [Pseudomonadota bacterium]
WILAENYKFIKYTTKEDCWTIINVPDGLTYLLNRKTGSTWRWYRNYKKGEFAEFEEEGWTPVLFDVGLSKFTDPNNAQATLITYTNIINKIDMKNIQKKNQQK